MSRLTDKLKAAAAVAPRQASKIEARADALLAQEADIEKRTEEAFLPHELLLHEAQSALDDVKHAMATKSNNPPLQLSTGSPAAVDQHPNVVVTDKGKVLGG